MMMKQAVQVYREVQTHTSGPLELVIMLYEGAIRFLYQAALGIGVKDMEMSHNNLVKAQRVIEELQFAVDRSYGPTAEALVSLYAFMISELEMANTGKDLERVRAVLNLLEELLNAWRSAAQPPEAA